MSNVSLPKVVVVLFDQVARFFSDHYNRRVRIAAYNCRHDACVGDAQVLHAVYSESAVHDRARIRSRAHLARARRVVDGEGELPEAAFPVLVREERVSAAAGQRYRVRPRPVLLKGGRVRDGHRDFDAFH